MPDLAVHWGSAVLVAPLLRSRPARLCLYLGVFLPDLLFKTMVVVLRTPFWFAEPTHAPLVVPVYTFALAFFFEERFRPTAFRGMTAGAWLHILLDAGKDQLGNGAVLWGFPFTMHRVSFGWFPPEASTYAALPALLLVAVVERRLGRSATPPPSPPTGGSPPRAPDGRSAPPGGSARV